MLSRLKSNVNVEFSGVIFYVKSSVLWQLGWGPIYHCMAVFMQAKSSHL